MNEVTNGIAALESSFEKSFLSLWNFQIFAVEGSPITVGKLTIGLILVVLGYFLSRLISHAVHRRLLSRTKIQASMQYTLERMVFYFVYVFIVLFILQLLSIPVTVFTLVGGVLAIGIGFGSQNIVSNFISGLIVMIEQPVRTGDWIEIEGVFGQIETIGSRSTYIRMLDNKQSVIPNSFFLEKPFTNWTLSDSLVSGRLNIGVAYGTSPEKVREVLLRAASMNPEVLKEPGPSVLFQDFGASSLDFTLIFWIHFGQGRTVARVASDLRYQISGMLQNENINIPFPHREILVKNPIMVTMNGG
jgi:small-conductance mechanosensitive channel